MGNDIIRIFLFYIIMLYLATEWMNAKDIPHAFFTLFTNRIFMLFTFEQKDKFFFREYEMILREVRSWLLIMRW